MTAGRHGLDLRGEEGMTLPELLIAMVVSMIVLIAAFTLLDTTIGVSARVQRSVDSMQRGRAAMDTIVRDLRSQVCLPSSDPETRPNVGSLAAGAPTSVDFYADLGDGSATQPPQRRTITFDAAARTIVERVYRATGPAGDYVFPATPDVTRTLLTDVVQDGSTPVFSFYTFDRSVSPPTPTTPLDASSGLAPAALASTARISIAFKVLRAGGTDASSGAARLQDDVFRRAIDPNTTALTPECW
jgi:type II secretory pathway pseudopilin PulG